MQEDKIKVSYFNKIDVIRFLAAMMIVVYHTYNGWRVNWGYPKLMTVNGDAQHLTQVGKWVDMFIVNCGGFGVDIFFLISGFLITYLLLKEKEAFGKIDFFKCYVRRSLR